MSALKTIDDTNWRLLTKKTDSGKLDDSVYPEILFNLITASDVYRRLTNDNISSTTFSRR